MKENTNKNYLKEELYNLLVNNIMTDAPDWYGINDYGQEEASEMLWKQIEESDWDSNFKGNLEYDFHWWIELTDEEKEQADYIIEMIKYLEMKGDRQV